MAGKRGAVSSQPQTNQETVVVHLARKKFVAQKPGQLSIERGDQLKQLRDKSGWSLVVNTKTRTDGWVPSSYLKVVELPSPVRRGSTDSTGMRRGSGVEVDTPLAVSPSAARGKVAPAGGGHETPSSLLTMLKKAPTPDP